MKFVSFFKKSNRDIVFFHPYSESGGGGERVLWTMISILQNKGSNVILYSGKYDDIKCDIISCIKKQFNINIDPSLLKIVFVYKRNCIHYRYHPFLTLVSQGLASLILGIQIVISRMWLSPYTVLFDTTGLPFCYPLFKLFGMKVIPYVHYPTISSDMMKSIQYTQYSVNSMIKKFKLIYYRLFGILYWILGQCTDHVLVNSTWTQDHIVNQWNLPKNKVKILYPSVEVESLLNFEKDREQLLISIGQFRPEKRHIFQLKMAKEYFSHFPDTKYRFVLIGGCRNQDDENLVQSLKEFIQKHDSIFKGRVSLAVNVSFKELLEYLSKADIGIHTMKEEHFGIGIVEFMAAGVIAIANDSGGPKTDIIGPFSNDRNVGYLCDTIDEYVHSLEILTEKSKKNEKHAIRSRARQSVITRFSEDIFKEQFLSIPIFRQ